MTAREHHRHALDTLPPTQWEAYLAAHSGLPGPRGNLELMAAVGDLAPAEQLRAWSSADDEYLACCGTAGLGRLALQQDDTSPSPVTLLRARASDERWRVREAVAMALQRIGDGDPDLLVSVTRSWSDGSPYVLRAAVAGLCEPRLLRDPGLAGHTLHVLGLATEGLRNIERTRRRDVDVRVLRQGLAYAWSVAVAARPAAGVPLLERWVDVEDPDVRWVLRQNLRKSRLQRAAPDAVARMGAALGVDPRPRSRAQPTRSSAAAPTE